MNSRFSRFEELAERLVEGSLGRLLNGGLHPETVATRLARAMEDGADRHVAPDHYQVRLSPADRDALLKAEPELDRILADHLVTIAEQAGLVLHRDPAVRLVADQGQSRGAVAVAATITGEDSEYTRAFDPASVRAAPQEAPDGCTYLIVEGGRHFPLTETVYTLGRRLDCDIVLTDPRVSRQHAQLRWRAGRYVLFDLGSTAGTTVNGYPIKEAVLEPGDVFSLGGVDMIVGVETPGVDTRSDTAPTRPWRGGGRASDDDPESS